MLRNITRALVTIVWAAPMVWLVAVADQPPLWAYLLMPGIPLVFMALWLLSTGANWWMVVLVAVTLALLLYTAAVFLSALFLWFIPAAAAALITAPITGSPPRAYSR